MDEKYDNGYAVYYLARSYEALQQNDQAIADVPEVPGQLSREPPGRSTAPAPSRGWADRCRPDPDSSGGYDDAAGSGNTGSGGPGRGSAAVAIRRT